VSEYRIGFNNPGLVGQELTYMADTILRRHSAANGTYTRRCEGFLEGKLGSPKVLLTTSCTDALELTALLLRIKPGDEVLLPSFTFVSTANAFVLRGARPVFIDIRPDTLNMDPDLLSSAITPKTKAIVPVHYAGVGCEMDRICTVAAKHSLAIVEDNAHGLFSRYRNKFLGTFGCCATQSFHETKNVICGEGGALVVNDPALIERAEILRQKGTDRSRFDRGEVDKYTWLDVGSSFLPSDILAAFLFAQLERYEYIQAKRKKIWDTYFDQLFSWAQEHQVQLPHIPDYCEQSYHMFYMIMPSTALRNGMIQHLKRCGIMAVFHYVPLHESPMGRRLSPNASCPVTSRVSSCLLRLPFYNDLSECDQSEILNAIQRFGAWKEYQVRAAGATVMAQ
jgi:dTDP-4-amino-4,6-dideoxygalactose transaminase